jgi:hypothetical protein
MMCRKNIWTTRVKEYLLVNLELPPSEAQRIDGTRNQMHS